MIKTNIFRRLASRLFWSHSWNHAFNSEQTERSCSVCGETQTRMQDHGGSLFVTTIQGRRKLHYAASGQADRGAPLL